jgi:phosphate transport system permease protein
MKDKAMASLSSPRKFAPVPSSPLGRALQHGDIPFKILIALSSLSLLALMAGVGVMLWLNSEPARARTGLSFITQATWNPVGEVFGAAPFIVGTLVTSLVAVLIALPLGLGISIFLAELCPSQLRTLIGFMVGAQPGRHAQDRRADERTAKR